MRDVIKAVEAKPKQSLDQPDKNRLQRYQVENAILGSEVKVLQQRIEALKNEVAKQDSLDRALVGMDSQKLKKLKGRLQKRAGVKF